MILLLFVSCLCWCPVLWLSNEVWAREAIRFCSHSREHKSAQERIASCEQMRMISNMRMMQNHIGHSNLSYLFQSASWKLIVYDSDRFQTFNVRLCISDRSSDDALKRKKVKTDCQMWADHEIMIVRRNWGEGRGWVEQWQENGEWIGNNCPSGEYSIKLHMQWRGHATQIIWKSDETRWWAHISQA